MIDFFYFFYLKIKFHEAIYIAKDANLISGNIFFIYIQGSLNKFPDFFVWALLLIVHT